MSKDTRIVFGARCTWWDSIDKIGLIQPKKSGGIALPCCPTCASVLFEVETEAEWWKLVEKMEPTRWPGYIQFMEWLRGKCIPGGMLEAKRQWEASRAAT